MRDTLTFHARHASHQPALLCGRCESAPVSITAFHMLFTQIKILLCRFRVNTFSLEKTPQKHFDSQHVSDRFVQKKRRFRHMSVAFSHPAFRIKKKKALIYKAFLMVAAIGFEPMTLRV